MWMGGLLPLGYDTRDRKLAVNEAEAKQVQHVFTRYADLGSVRKSKTRMRWHRSSFPVDDFQASSRLQPSWPMSCPTFLRTGSIKSSCGF